VVFYLETEKHFRRKVYLRFALEKFREYPSFLRSDITAYLLTYLLTYLHHGAESFLRS